MVWRKVTSPTAGTSSTFGGNDVNRISDFFSGVSDSDGADFNSTVKFRDQKLVLRNPANTFNMAVKTASSLTAGSNNTYQFESKYSYLVFIDADDSNLVKAKNGHTGAIDFSNSDPTTTLNSVFSAISSTGGIVFLKRGTYVITAKLSVGSSSTPNVSIRLHGSARDATIIQFSGAATSTDMIQAFCNFSIDNLQVDGNSKGNNGLISNTGAVNITVTNCKFRNQLQSQVKTASPVLSFSAKNSFFDINASSSAQLSLTATSFVILEDNVFDRVTGTVTGDCAAISATKSVAIRNNIFNRASANVQEAIKIASVAANITDILVESNSITNGRIAVGLTTDTGTIRDTIIASNAITGGGISVAGPSAGVGTAIQNVLIANNTVKNSYLASLIVQNVAGPISIKHNILYDSNIGNDSNSADKGVMYIFTSNEVEITNNTLVAVSTAGVDVNPYLMTIDTCNTVRVFLNRFINTAATTVFAVNAPVTGLVVRDNAGFKTNGRAVWNQTAVGSSTTGSTVPATKFYSCPSPYDPGKLNGGGITRWAEKAMDSSSVIVGKTIGQVDAWLARSNSGVTGTVFARIRKGSDDSIAATIGSVSCSSIPQVSGMPSSPTKFGPNTTNTYVCVVGDKVSIEYSGGDSSHYIRIDLNASGPDGSHSMAVSYDGSYNSPNKDLAGNFWTVATTTAGTTTGQAIFTYTHDLAVIPDNVITYVGTAAAAKNHSNQNFDINSFDIIFNSGSEPANGAAVKFYLYYEKQVWP